MEHTDTIALQGNIADMRLRIAAEQAAMHKVRLGVARWSTAPAPQDADAPPSPASQTRWHAEAQCHFMCWLELGGFAHADAQADNATAPAMADMPSDTSINVDAGATAARETSAAPLPVHCNGCAV
ncbi:MULTISPECIES: hypothetical protein [unclassified Janthinobacterium]|uniref:hypothetical protein n=1 Tax=unclassified Janthinobacterium TaxID=2610881 RepID=UPI002713E277|nr:MULTISPECIES: hypothetical protein [unclassified Janthinobacterium]MDO8066533.1 hypothetical protein [Janthinobacterium sp. SUN206]MDO8072756.1 hypothetical protein [Janthinobacterium sp. SUN176]